MVSSPPRWRLLAGDLVGGTTAALVLLPVYGSLGLLALAPLGPAWASLAFMMGVLAAALCNPLSALAGHRGPTLIAPPSATVLLVPGLLLGLMARPAFQQADGTPAVPLLLAALALALGLAGALQWALARLRLTAVIRYAPYPVHAGFMLGVAVLMVLAMWRHAAGLRPGQPLLWSPALLGPLAVAALSCALVLRPPAPLRRVPGVLLALVLGTAAHEALVSLLGPHWGGATLGPLAVAWPVPAWWPGASAAPGWGPALASAAGPLLLFAVVLALTATLQTLMANAAIDTLAGQRSDSEALVRAQGVANAVGGLAGLLSVSSSAAYTAIGQHAGSTGTASRVAHGVALVAALTVGAPLIAHLPLPVIAGIFFAMAWGLVDPWSRRLLREGAQALRRARLPAPAQRGPLVVVLGVAVVAVQVSLVVGILLGCLLAVLQFVRGHLRPPVRRVVGADRQPSRRVRPAADVACLRAQGHRIVLVTLDGPLFFGTADAAAQAIEREAAHADEVVLDFRRVPEVDVSGARVLLQAAAGLRAQGRRLLLAGLHAADPRARHLVEMDAAGLLVPQSFQPDADRALEQAEDRLLAAHGARALAADAPLTLAQTPLGAGLDAAARARLAAVLGECQLTAGTHVFRRGDPGDALYLLRSGQVAICLPGPGGDRRLVSYAPGVVFGEIGLLRGTPRTADAVVEADAALWVLDRATYTRLCADDPALVGCLLQHVALQLSDRLAALTLTLEALDDAPRQDTPAA